jgi:hypothetical protein
VAIDPATFKPSSADELLKGLLEVAIGAAKGTWDDLKKTITEDLTTLSEDVLKTSQRLADGVINPRQATHSMKLLDAAFSNEVLLVEIVPYAIAQAVINAVFGLVNSVIRNFTGVDLGLEKMGAS